MLVLDALGQNLSKFNQALMHDYTMETTLTQQYYNAVAADVKFGWTIRNNKNTAFLEIQNE